MPRVRPFDFVFIRIHPARSMTAEPGEQPALNEDFCESAVYAVFRSDPVWPRPSPNNRIISRLKAGMSSGFRLVTRLGSLTTSLSTQVAPAFLRSVFNEGHEVTVRPRTAPASISVQGPWQIAATG